MRTAYLFFILWPCLALPGAQAINLQRGHLSKTPSAKHAYGYTGLAPQSQFVRRTYNRRASELKASEPFSETFLQLRSKNTRSSTVSPETGGNPVAAGPAHKRLSAHLDSLRGEEDSQEFEAVTPASSASVQSSPGEGSDSGEGKDKEKNRRTRSRKTSRRIRELVGKRVTAAVQAPSRLAHCLQNYLVENVKKLLQRIRSSHGSAVRAPVLPVTGRGYHDVARAVASAPHEQVNSQRLRKVKVTVQDKLLSRYMPKHRRLVFASLRDDRSILFERREMIGSGPFGIVMAFVGDNNIKLAAKMFTVQESALQTQLRMRAQLELLNYVPTGEDVYLFSQKVQLALPYDVLRLRNTEVIMKLPGGEDMVNAFIIQEFFETNVKWLLRVLLPSRPEDIPALISVTQQAVTCISNLHKLGLFHLDIKPENFLVGRDGRVFATDFGFKEGGFLKASLKYSPGYAAPELADTIVHDKALNLTDAADSWSLGVFLYEVWCRKLPFDVPAFKSPTLGLVAGLTGQSLKLDAQCTKKMPPQILDLVKQFLQIDPAARLTPTKALEFHPALISGATESEARSPE
uniref:Rhoptry kinase family protein ROP17 n=1 Tax=Eimeria stiedai TaxID=471275 RepID=A0A977JPT5_9EIME|nr:putative rhoptry kinase family protein ROP17 [Eimeria stiedai]